MPNLPIAPKCLNEIDSIYWDDFPDIVFSQEGNMYIQCSGTMLDKSCNWASHKPMLYSTANRKPGRRWAWSQETTSIRRLAGSSADGRSSSNTGDPFHINKYALNPTKFDSIMISRFRIMWWFHGKTGGLNAGTGLEKHIKWGNGWKRHIVPSTIRRVKECKRNFNHYNRIPLTLCVPSSSQTNLRTYKANKNVLRPISPRKLGYKIKSAQNPHEPSRSPSPVERSIVGEVVISSHSSFHIVKLC